MRGNPIVSLMLNGDETPQSQLALSQLPFQGRHGAAHLLTFQGRQC